MRFHAPSNFSELSQKHLSTGYRPIPRYHKESESAAGELQTSTPITTSTTQRWWGGCLHPVSTGGSWGTRTRLQRGPQWGCRQRQRNHYIVHEQRRERCNVQSEWRDTLLPMWVRRLLGKHVPPPDWVVTVTAPNENRCRRWNCRRGGRRCQG